MKLHLNRFCNSVYGILALIAGWHNHIYAQGTAFTYQGRLNTNGSPANGLYDFRFKLYFDSLGNTQVGEAFATNGIPTTNGLFVAGVEFGAGIFTGTNYWLEVDVRTNGATSYTVLTPLQPVTPTPYAIYANTASNLSGTLPASQLSGSLSSAQLGGTYSNAVKFTNAADTFSGTFSGSFTGSGSGLADVWHTGGNLGTAAGTNFLGTTDNQPLELHVNATRVLRLEPDSRGLSAGNVIGGYISNAVIQPGSGSDVIAGGGYSGGPNVIYSNSSGVFIGAGSVNSVGPNVNDSVIAGGYGNSVQSPDSAIAGGYYNTIQANTPLSFIGGGNDNTIQANAGGAIIGGGNNSTIETNADHSIIAGGWQNIVQFWGYESVIGGGAGNDVGPYGQFAVIGGGAANAVGPNTLYAVIAGGNYNTNSASHSFIGSGYGNTIQSNSDGSVISGGENNVIQPNSPFGTIGGGQGHTIQSASAVIGGGYSNTIQTNSQAATIVGGVYNMIQTNNEYAFIGGGNNNTIQANAYGAIITGGNASVIQTNADHSVIAGGWQNIVQYWGYESVIGGGTGNAVGPYGQFAVIGGGAANAIGPNTLYAVISGGNYNTNSASYSFIGSGSQNTIQSNVNYSVISGGTLNIIGTNCASSVIAGGAQNVIQTNAGGSVIGGGNYNTVQGIYAVIGGGISNRVTLLGGTVPGGVNNCAFGYDSFAAGTGAQAINDGSFVLADYEPANTNNFSSTTNNQFSGRFNGGVRFVTSGAGMTVDEQPVLAGSVGSGQLSGTYTNSVTFNNPADTFVGNGSGLTNVNAATLGGLPASAYAQLNTNATFNNTRVTGLLRSGSETGTSEAPSPAGLVVRRINSTSFAASQVVAETDNLTLLRDGTAGGFQINIPALVGNVTIACMGVNSAGTPVFVYKTVANPSTNQTFQIYTDAQNIVHFECTFGRTYNSGAHLTQVTLSRFGTDYFWSGNVISTYNQ
jgi:hypothetical protein